MIAHSTCPADVVALTPFDVLTVSSKVVKSTFPNPLNCLAVPLGLLSNQAVNIGVNSLEPAVSILFFWYFLW